MAEQRTHDPNAIDSAFVNESAFTVPFKRGYRVVMTSKVPLVPLIAFSKLLYGKILLCSLSLLTTLIITKRKALKALIILYQEVSQYRKALERHLKGT